MEMAESRGLVDARCGPVGLNRDESGLSAFRHSGIMEPWRFSMDLAKIGKKGQLTIPRSVLKAAGISEESRVVLEATSDGAIVLRPVAVYPVETYSDERVREFEETNA